ncbi:hypothetical protein HRR83_003735 [Exophiala dermatitidis]|uniref:Sensor histidine kinase/response regulator n=2 Tax=Exophiala dermatitidis TaxID=5970 RepID=H6BP75_EXODN|nr:sensor histidine kinase/response regulator [Exophiala dermatitidis NIH/UT8656]KAJ4518962.1 hypothetical protein HRR75_002638 [Exophiala dermatitidis]EHY53530.1 sensor histidine kinase/response regulator [Exophiala dermatitidis NIH/UT8656]KAJ4522300.1 hypothetical protein HRR74_002883 [Exophiala dermatitidis]KAJ4529625.1 hypothetical protein HRR73_000651 [Exophiala dermatitidis]KAJ4543211.1 hypothetical protein HRR77_005468 [Exophiala dermatitidis]
MAREGARERDMHRYYQPWLETFISSDLHPTVQLPPDNHVEGHQPRSSRDKALTAFAQLGCLRLNAKRGLVTLLDSSKQYIIAEATKSLSLMDDSQHEAGDELWYGNTYIDRGLGISAEAMHPGSYTARAANGTTYSAPALVVDDLAADERFKSRPYAGKGISFYCGVPITTKLGHVIGVYTVTDDKPRSGLSPDQLRFMTDMAVIVVQHLEIVKNERARARGERLIQGIGTFIEGDATEEAAQIKPDSRPPPPFNVQSEARRMSSEAQADGVDTESPGTNNSAERTDPNETGVEEGDQGPAAPESDLPSEHDVLISELQRRQALGVVHEGTIPARPKRLHARDRSTATKEKAFSDSLRVFDRAAAILRDCLCVDGVVYLNASSANLSSGSSMQNANQAVSVMQHSHNKTKRGNERKSTANQPAEDARHDFSAHDSTASDSSTATGKSSTDSSSARPVRQNAEVLGIARLQPGRPIKIPEQTLRRFVRRHSDGKCFSFDQHGKPSSSDETSDSNPNNPDDTAAMNEDQASKAPLRHFPTTNALMKAFPGARKIVFLPLWDFAKGRWHSGMVIWSNDPNRLTNIQDDISYLKAFNNAVMNEVNRINLALSDTAKATFLANISHELRSPLHGILGSIEFLHDTAMDDFQSSMVISVETCGKTLLDTVNHVLDYAKINSLSKGGSLRSNSRDNHHQIEPSNSDSSLVEDFDMAVVVEEAVEAVYAGQVFRTANADGVSGHGQRLGGGQTAADRAMQKRRETKENVSQASVANKSSVRLTLNIDDDTNWMVRSQPGAVRRIVMNILGNALKYTSRGSIDVALKVDDSRKKSSSNLHMMLKVTDTGRGMSGEFMKNHAFTAFSQEDSLATGTGLGLSIVRQIVDSLGGTIDLSSEKDIGTEVKIWLSLPKSQKEDSSDSDRNLIAEIREMTKGLELCLLLPHLLEKPEVHPTPRTLRPMPSVEDSIRNLMAQWFKMKVRAAPNMEGDPPPNFFIYPEPPPIDYLMDRHGRTKTNREIPVIVLCTNAFEAASLRSHGIHRLTDIGRIIEVIAQPCGPQKIAKVLQRCMQRMKLLDSSHSPGATDQVPMSVERNKEADLATVPSANAAKTQGINHSNHDNVQVDGTGSDHNKTGSPSSSNGSATPRESDGSSVRADDDTKPRVLVVDDNHINLHLLITFVKKANHPHESATDGAKAVEAYKRSVLNHGGKQGFKYILMDISMPVMNGIVATKEIRKFEEEQGIETPATIIALTGLGSESAQSEAYQAGFDHFLSKPIKFKDLQTLLR